MGGCCSKTQSDTISCTGDFVYINKSQVRLEQYLVCEKEIYDGKIKFSRVLDNCEYIDMISFC